MQPFLSFPLPRLRWLLLRSSLPLCLLKTLAGLFRSSGGAHTVGSPLALSCSAQVALASAQEQLAAVLAKVQALKGKYDDSTCRKKALEDELSDLEGKLERAEKLVQGLAGGLGVSP